MTAPQPTPPPGDQARASVRVDVDVDAAFRIFTEEIDLWWRRGPAYRNAPGQTGLVRLEPPGPSGEGGRVLESWVDGEREQVFVSGRITRWDPPRRFVMTWRGINFTHEDLDTEVEVAFVAQARGTLVTVTHRGWSRIRSDHPVRHGQAAPAFVGSVARWWGELLSGLRHHAVATV